MITARRVGKTCVNSDRADQVLWELSKEIVWNEYEKDYVEGYTPKRTKFVITSAVDVLYSGPETYMFPANEHGEIINWGEMPGSFKGEFNHEKCIIGAGWKILE